jgi:hypothetical protein
MDTGKWESDFEVAIEFEFTGLKLALAGTGMRFRSILGLDVPEANMRIGVAVKSGSYRRARLLIVRAERRRWSSSRRGIGRLGLCWSW